MTIDERKIRERLEDFVDQVKEEQSQDDYNVNASPGPWTLQPISKRRSCGVRYTEYAIRDKRNWCLAVVGGVNAITDGGEGWSNARLMRAAPELAAHLLRLKMDHSLVEDDSFWEQIDLLFDTIDTGVEVKGKEESHRVSDHLDWGESYV